MTKRDRALAMLRDEQPDCIPWYGDLSYWLNYMEATGSLDEKYLGDGQYQLYRDVGVGFYLQGYWPFRERLCGDVEISKWHEGPLRYRQVRTPLGSIREVWKYLEDTYSLGPVEHFIKDLKDLKVLRYWISHITYEDDYALAERRGRGLIGDNGLNLCYLPRSPFMELMVNFAGVESLTYALFDDPAEVEETLAVMEDRFDLAARIAVDSPAECLMIPENLTAENIGPDFQRRFLGPYEKKWTERIRSAGKFSFVHLDGTMKGIISETAESGFDVLEALTPAPVGDLEFQDIHSWVGSDAIVWGGLPGALFAKTVTDQAFDDHVVRVLKVMREGTLKGERRYVLGVADQVPPDVSWERIARVNRLVEEFGRLD